jgi:hypothetical protein
MPAQTDSTNERTRPGLFSDTSATALLGPRCEVESKHASLAAR